jgi:exosome complex RNA-binding protein Csl4
MVPNSMANNPSKSTRIILVRWRSTRDSIFARRGFQTKAVLPFRVSTVKRVMAAVTKSRLKPTMVRVLEKESLEMDLSKAEISVSVVKSEKVHSSSSVLL